MRRAMLGVGFPCALAKSIWLRRTVKPCDDRRPASSSACSFSVSGRTKSGACIVLHFTTCPTTSFGLALRHLIDPLAPHDSAGEALLAGHERSHGLPHGVLPRD